MLFLDVNIEICNKKYDIRERSKRRHYKYNYRKGYRFAFAKNTVVYLMFFLFFNIRK